MTTGVGSRYTRIPVGPQPSGSSGDLNPRVTNHSLCTRLPRNELE